jgi:hypothetical protein
MRCSVLLATVALLLTVSPRAVAQFETRGDFVVSGPAAPYSLAVGDFNGDGILDIAAVLEPPGTVDILIGNGDGTFRQGSTYLVGTSPQYPVAASLRHNGILDLILSDLSNDNVWVMLGKGDGTFQPPVAFPTTAEAYMVALGDFTGSGNLDIVTTEGYSTQLMDFCNCLEVLPGNGDGTFGAPITTRLPYGLTAYVIAAGDFNDDGKLDIAAAGESLPNMEIAILLGNGNGTFNADGHYLVSSSCSSLAAGYFTSSKKKLDLAVVESLYVLLGNGNGIFDSPVAYQSNTLPSKVIAQDLDGDGKVDLVTSDVGSYKTNPAGVTVYKGNGNGTFQNGVFYHVGADEGGHFLATGDFNGDGKPDLVVVNEVNSIITTLLNTGVVSFSPTTPLNFKNQAVGTKSNPLTVILTNTGSTALRIASMKASTEFAVTSTCGASVAAGAKCTISATFSPTQKGARQGTISVIDSASTKPQVIELLGTGT